MKLLNITIDHFLRINDMDLALGGTKVHLFAGHNEVGKTSLAEAIRFAVLGDSPRVKLKKDYTKLVSHGSKKGSIDLVTDKGTITRNLPSGASSGDLDTDLDKHVDYEILLGATHFMGWAEKARREYLFRLCGVGFDADNIMKRLKKKKMPASLEVKVKALLSVAESFDPVVKRAGTEIVQGKGAWEEITGDRFGSAKAKGWMPVYLEPRPKKPTKAALDKAIKLNNAADIHYSDTNRLYGAASSSRDAANKALLELAGIEESVKQAVSLKTRKAARDIQISGAEADIRGLEERATQMQNASDILSCPSCDTQLRYVNNDLEIATDEQLNAEAEAKGDSLANVTEGIREERGRLAGLRSQRDEIQQQLDIAANAEGRSVELSKIVAAGDEKLVKQTYDDMLAAGAERDKTSANLEVLKKIIEQYEQDGKKTKRAEELRVQIGDWQKVKDLLSPNGIPAELVAEALGSFNENLKDSCEASGWPLIQIAADMMIYRGQTPYTLLSESAMWKANTALMYTIARMSDIRLMLLDRMDVLDIAGRVQCVGWLQKVCKHFDTILVFATMKSAPAKLPGDTTVHWMDNGEIANAA